MARRLNPSALELLRRTHGNVGGVLFMILTPQEEMCEMFDALVDIGARVYHGAAMVPVTTFSPDMFPFAGYVIKVYTDNTAVCASMRWNPANIKSYKSIYSGVCFEVDEITLDDTPVYDTDISFLL